MVTTRYKTDFLEVDTYDDDVDENELQPLDQVEKELLKNALFLEVPVENEDVLPVPVAMKAKLSL